MFDLATPIGFHPAASIDANRKMISQKSSLVGKHGGAQPYAFQGFPMQGTNGFHLPINQPNIHLSNDPRLPPMALGGNYLKGNAPSIGLGQSLPALRQQKTLGGGPTFAAPVIGCANGAAVGREKGSSIPATAQLTIFYGGYVNVYDNVPFEKAQAIMFMAANSSMMTPTTPIARSQAPPAQAASPRAMVVPEAANTTLPLPKSNLASPCSGFSSPVSAVSHSAAHSTSSTSNPDERKGHATTPMQNEPAKLSATDAAPGPTNSPMAKPVPMMRKLSLARFLEKRKERFTNLSPYPPTEKPFESIDPGSPDRTTRLEIGTTTAKEWPSSNSNGRLWSWQCSTAENSSEGKPPNTRLEI